MHELNVGVLGPYMPVHVDPEGKPTAIWQEVMVLSVPVSQINWEEVDGVPLLIAQVLVVTAPRSSVTVKVTSTLSAKVPSGFKVMLSVNIGVPTEALFGVAFTTVPLLLLNS